MNLFSSKAKAEERAAEEGDTEKQLLAILGKLVERQDVLEKRLVEYTDRVPEMIASKMAEAGSVPTRDEEKVSPMPDANDLDAMSGSELVAHMAKHHLAPVSQRLDEAGTDAYIQRMVSSFEKMAERDPEVAMWGPEILTVMKSPLAESGNLSPEQAYILAKGGATDDRRKEVAEQLGEGEGADDKSEEDTVISFFPNRVAENTVSGEDLSPREASEQAWKETFGGVKEIQVSSNAG